MQKHSVKIISRRSQLAIVQAMMVQEQIYKVAKLNSSLIPVISPGDNTNTKFGDFNLKNLFTKNLDKAVLEDKADLAVHSLKDLGILQNNSNLYVSGYLKRENAQDIIITKNAKNLEEIKKGGIFLTSSLRRKAQIITYDPLAKVYPIRGNIITRLKQFASSNEINAMVIAKAGINRLRNTNINPKLISDYKKLNPDASFIDFTCLQKSLKKLNIHFFEAPFELFLPAANQGQIACTVLKNNTNITNILDNISHNESKICALTERTFIRLINANCHMPLAALAQISNKTIIFKVKFYNALGNILFDFDQTAPIQQYLNIAQVAADQFLKVVKSNNKHF